MSTKRKSRTDWNADLIEVINTCAGREIYNELRRPMMFKLQRDDLRQLHRFLRCLAFDIQVFKAWKEIILSQICRQGWDEMYLAGILRSWTTSPILRLPSTSRVIFFDCTLTTTRAGFRRPTRTSSESASASVIVALNSPVRRCFGRWLIIRVIVV